MADRPPRPGLPKMWWRRAARELRRAASALARTAGADQLAGTRPARGGHTAGLGALELSSGLFLFATGDGVVLRRIHDGRLP